MVQMIEKEHVNRKQHQQMNLLISRLDEQQRCPLRDLDLVWKYLRDTTTQTGLRLTAQLVTRVYQKGLEVADEVMAALNITYHTICPQWNYTIRPRPEVAGY